MSEKPTTTIRRFRADDASLFHAAVLESVDHAGQWLPWCTTRYSLEDAMTWTSSAASCWEKGTDYRFVVVDASSANILGGVGISQVVAQHRAGNLGYWVRASALNRGVCTAAARLACEFAFQHLKFVRLDVHVHPDNMASNSVAAKLGGVFEGTQRNRIMMHGEPCAANCYSIIPSDLGITCCGDI